MKIVFTLLIAGFGAVLFAAAVPLKPGQYEIVSEFSGSSGEARIPIPKVLHCYTAQELEDMPKTAGRRKDSQDCKVVSSKTTGTTLTYTTACESKDGSRSTINGETTFMSPESYRTVVTFTDSSGRETNPLFNGRTMTITGKRIGDCSK